MSHADTGRVSALKRVNDEKYTTNFAREISMLSMLDHPNIVSLEYSDPLSRYYVMSYVEGDTLEKEVELKKKSDYKKLGYMFNQLLDGVAHMHEQKVVHLDIKPQNIMYDKRRGKLYLIDFGIARRINNNSTSTEGSIYFSSPEMVLNEKIDGQSDIYSLGATLYYVLTQKYLYDEEEGNIVEAVADLYRQPVIPRKYNRNIPPSLEAICLKACQKQRARRYSNVDEYIEDIEVYCRGGSPNIPHKIYSFNDKVISHRYKLTSLALGIVLSVGGYGISSLKSAELENKLESIEKKVKLAESIQRALSSERDKAKLLEEYQSFVASIHRGSEHELLKSKKEIDRFFGAVGEKIEKDNYYYMSYLIALNHNLNKEKHISVSEHQKEMRKIVNILSKREISESVALELFKYTGYLDIKERSKAFQNMNDDLKFFYNIIENINDFKNGKNQEKSFYDAIDGIGKLVGDKFNDIKSELYVVIFDSCKKKFEQNVYEKMIKLLNENRGYRIKVLDRFNIEIENMGIHFGKKGIRVDYYLQSGYKIKSKKGKKTFSNYRIYLWKLFQIFKNNKYNTETINEVYKMFYELDNFYKKVEKNLKEDRFDVLLSVLLGMSLPYGKVELFSKISSEKIDKDQYGTHIYKENEIPSLLHIKEFEIEKCVEYVKRKESTYPYTSFFFPGKKIGTVDLVDSLYVNLDNISLGLQKDLFYLFAKCLESYVISENFHIQYFPQDEVNKKVDLKKILNKYQSIHEHYSFLNKEDITKEDIQKFTFYMNMLRTLYLVDGNDDEFTKSKYDLFYREDYVGKYMKKAYEYSMYKEEGEMMYLLLLDRYENKKSLSYKNDKYMKDKFSAPYSYENIVDNYYFLSSFYTYKIINLYDVYFNGKEKLKSDLSWRKLWKEYFYANSFYFGNSLTKKSDYQGIFDLKQENILRIKNNYYYMLNYILENNSKLLNKDEESDHQEWIGIMKKFKNYYILRNELNTVGNEFVEEWLKNE